MCFRANRLVTDMSWDTLVFNNCKRPQCHDHVVNLAMNTNSLSMTSDAEDDCVVEVPVSCLYSSECVDWTCFQKFE